MITRLLGLSGCTNKDMIGLARCHDVVFVGRLSLYLHVYIYSEHAFVHYESSTLTSLVPSHLPSLVNQTVYHERACMSEKGRGGRKIVVWPNSSHFLDPRQNPVVTNHIADLVFTITLPVRLKPS